MLEVTPEWVMSSIVVIVAVSFTVYLGIKKIIILELEEMENENKSD